ncbi:MAG: CsiV family protein, partial [Gammaproteobacteria bacterium]
PLADHATAASVRIGTPPPAPAVTSAAGLAVTPLPQPAQASGINAANPAVRTSPGQTQPAIATPTPVYGSVKFSQYGPYLHFDVNLVCQGPIAKNIMRVPTAATMTLPVAAAPIGAAPVLQWYRMIQDRRIEAGKLNYFDNPMFGVLVLVTPHPATSVTH